MTFDGIDKFLKQIRHMNEIDLANLEVECQRQDKLVGKCAKYVADARKGLADLEAALEVAQVNAKAAVRKNPAKYGLERATDGGVKEVFPINKRYQEAAREVREAKHLVDTLTGVMSRLENRKRMLEKLVDLHGQNYFSRPRTSGATGSYDRDRPKAGKPYKK